MSVKRGATHSTLSDYVRAKRQRDDKGQFIRMAPPSDVVEDLPAVKICVACNEPKRLSEFCKDSRSAARGGDGLCARCRDCQKLYREANKSHIRERDKRYRERVADVRAVKKRAWYQANRDASVKRRKERRRANLESERATVRERYKRNRKRVIQYVRAWQIANADKRKAVLHRRRCQARNSGRFSGDEWHALKAQYRFTCLCCEKKEPEIKLTPDHVIPLVSGGANTIDNIQPLCLHCNLVKNKKTRLLDK